LIRNKSAPKAFLYLFYTLKAELIKSATLLILFLLSLFGRWTPWSNVQTQGAQINGICFFHIGFSCLGQVSSFLLLIFSLEMIYFPQIAFLEIKFSLPPPPVEPGPRERKQRVKKWFLIKISHTTMLRLTLAMIFMVKDFCSILL
jgi:hypothetical protein